MYETAILGIVSTFVGTIFGWYLRRWSERDLLKVSAIREELTNALGPLYSVVHQREKSVAQGVIITEKEKEKLDHILATYPHMLPSKITLEWHLSIRDSKPLLKIGTYQPTPYAIPVQFRKMVVEEFCERLTEYFKATGQSERLKEIDEYRKPWE